MELNEILKNIQFTQKKAGKEKQRVKERMGQVENKK